MAISIRKQTLESNILAVLLGSVAGTSLLGTIVYQLFGWPQSTLAVILILAIPVATTLWLLNSPRTIHDLPVAHRPPIFILFNLALGILIAAAIIYAIRHTANGWIGSPWQAVSLKFILLICGIIFATAWGIVGKKISARILFCALTLLLAINTLLFPLGFGFDVFVHDATIRAWIEHGTISPISPLYNGFHSIIAAFANITNIRPLIILSWLVPFIGAGILTAVLLVTRATREDFHRAPYILLGFFLIFSSLFTTATPQSLGHFLLFGLINELWLVRHEISTKRWVLRALVAFGIFCIHPLSGIPALATVAWLLIAQHKSRIIRRIAYTTVGTLTVIAPAALLMIGAGGTFEFSQLTVQALSELFIHSPTSFQPFIATKLAYITVTLGPALLLISALFGYAVKHPHEQQERRLFTLSLLLIFAGYLTRGISIINIISYEQASFAGRVIITGYLLMIPLASAGFAHIWSRAYARYEHYTIAAVCIAGICAAWFVAYPGWNTVTRTKAINVSAQDFEIVTAIDSRVQDKPYIVLADQPTSAAALYTFGFYDRQLTKHDFYFYPIPTGAELYTQFFLPAMYQGVTHELLTAAARNADVQDVFIVAKPYWNLNDARIKQLKQNTTDSFNAGGAVIGHFRLTK